MSEFTFTNDLQGGTATSVADTPETGAGAPESKAGSATESYATCSIKKLLATMRANSTVTVCGDLRIQSGDLYLQADDQGVGGAAGSSLIKEIGLVYGKFEDNGDFTMLDPNPSDESFRGQIDDTEEDDGAQDGDADYKEDYSTDDESVTDGTLENKDADGLLDTRGGKWYFRVVRPGGDVKHILVEPLNNLIDAMSAVGGETKSILGLVEDLGAVQEAIKGAMESEFDARVQDVNDLEDRFNLDVTSLRNWLKDMEYRVVQHAADEDIRLVATLTAAQMASGQQYQENYADVRLEGSVDLTVSQDCGSSIATQFTSDYEIKAAHSDIKKWMIQASVMDIDPATAQDAYPKLQLRHDLDLFVEAVLEAGVDSNAGMYRLKVDTSPVQCESMSGLKLGVKAIWCGDQPNQPARPSDQTQASYTSVPAISVNSGDAADADQGGRRLAEVSAPSIPDDAAINGSGSNSQETEENNDNEADPVADPNAACHADADYCGIAWSEGSQDPSTFMYAMSLYFDTEVAAQGFANDINDNGAWYNAVPVGNGDIDPDAPSNQVVSVGAQFGSDGPVPVVQSGKAVTFYSWDENPFTGMIGQNLGLQPGAHIELHLVEEGAS